MAGVIPGKPKHVGPAPGKCATRPEMATRHSPHARTAHSLQGNRLKSQRARRAVRSHQQLLAASTKRAPLRHKGCRSSRDRCRRPRAPWRDPKEAARPPLCQVGRRRERGLRGRALDIMAPCRSHRHPGTSSTRVLQPAASVALVVFSDLQQVDVGAHKAVPILLESMWRRQNVRANAVQRRSTRRANGECLDDPAQICHCLGRLRPPRPGLRERDPE